jgi:hypothetical protein
MIYPVSNTILINENVDNFTIKYEIDVIPILQMNLECRFGNQSSRAFVIGNRSIQCNISIQNDVDLTLWYSGNQTFQISNNSILLNRFKSSNISFNALSRQLGYSYRYETIIVDLNPISFSNFEGRVRCALNSSTFYTIKNQSNSYSCFTYTEIGSIFQLELYYSLPNSFEILSANGIFRDKIVIDMVFNGELLINSNIEITLNTKELIERNDLKNDCSDLVVTLNNSLLLTSILSCNTNSTKVYFTTIQTIYNGSKEYIIYYGNQYHSSIEASVPSRLTNVRYILIYHNNTMIPLSTNSLRYITVPKVEILDISPRVSFLGSTPISILSNVSINDYSKMLKFEVFDGFNLIIANLNNTKFTSILNSNSSQILNITIIATYKTTNESLITSFPSLFYYWSLFISLNF